VAKVSFRFEGGREVMAALRSLPDATAKNILRRVMKARAQPMADIAAAKAPKLTGALQKSVTVGTKLSRNQKSKHVKADPHDVEMFVGAGSLPQAHLEEFGGPNNQPTPFMRPALDTGADKYVAGIKQDLWREIKKSADRAARKSAKAT
jgi:HK97 gp10 family phage protein